MKEGKWPKTRGTFGSPRQFRLLKKVPLDNLPENKIVGK
jgi:hypothetical protein